MEFGPDNRKLLETIHRYRPDGILIAGDMIVRNDSASLKTASSLLRSLAQQYPVYYALGNHEYKLYRTDPQENCMAARYQEYEKELKKAGSISCIMNPAACRWEKPALLSMAWKYL